MMVTLLVDCEAKLSLSPAHQDITPNLLLHPNLISLDLSVTSSSSSSSTKLWFLLREIWWKSARFVLILVKEDGRRNGGAVYTESPHARDQRKPVHFCSGQAHQSSCSSGKIFAVLRLVVLRIVRV
ncbi:hypothetical protein SLA2020_132980 [Shorea laevis]